MPGKLTALQVRILTILARELEAPWVLTGGAALGGFYTQHRGTRDLDITPRDRRSVGTLPAEVEQALLRNGLVVDAYKIDRDRHQLRIADGSEVIVVEIIGAWSPAVEPPVSVELGPNRIQLDSPHELLVRKLMALFDRSEPRDLIDVEQLLGVGGDLPRALADAGRQFSGLSAATLARAVRTLPLERLASVLGWTPQAVAAAVRFRDDLVVRLATIADMDR